MTLCLHCLEEGDWADGDKCPSCAAKGHTSPWRVGSCEACNREFFAAIAEIQAKIDAREKATTRPQEVK